MKYYAKRKDGPPISGPYTLDELNAKLASSDMGRDWLVTSDAGETQEQLLKIPQSLSEKA